MKIRVIGAGALGLSFPFHFSLKPDEFLFYHKGNDSYKRSFFINNQKYLYEFKGIDEFFSESDDLVLICVKAYNIREVFQQISNSVKKVPILIFSNGAGFLEEIPNREALNIFRCITLIGSHRKDDIIRTHKGLIEIPKNLLSYPQLQYFFNAFRYSSLLKISEDIRKSIFRKLIFNDLINPLSAVLQVKNSRLLEDETLFIIEKLFYEAVQVLKLQNIEFSESIIDEVKDFLKESDNKSSMLQDILSGRRTEIDYITGFFIKNCGTVSIPYHEMLYRLVKSKEKLNKYSY